MSVDRTRARRVAAVMSAVSLTVALAGCSGSSKDAAPKDTTTVPPTTVSAPSTATTLLSTTTTVGRVASTTTTRSAAPSGPGYTAAKAQWLGAGLVLSGAAQNTALAIAVLDLENGESTDSGSKSGYAAAIAAIEDFEKLPITSVTPSEDAEGNADFQVVNTFFDLPGATDVPSCTNDPGSPAAAAWSSEPANTTSGILLGPLERAVSNLEPRINTNSCFPAAIADLQSLESATRADIVASSAETTGRGSNLYGAEITYLNVLFGTDVLTASS
jgi:hypothetical protein